MDIYLLSPTAQDLAEIIEECTDQSASWWVNKNYLMHMDVNSHSEKVYSTWSFASDPSYFLYPSQIRAIWDEDHSPEHTSVIVFACYADYNHYMRYAWIHADSYGAPSGNVASVFAGAKVNMYNYGFSYEGMSFWLELWDQIAPDSTADTFFGVIF